eukprot:g2977.t1
MNSDGNRGPISKLVSELLKKFVPTIDSDDRKKIALRRYCMRILGSAIGANSVGGLRDAVFVCENIKKRLIRARPHQKEGEHNASRFDLLYRRLETSRVVRNKWAILSLLEELANTGNNYSNANNNSKTNVLAPITFSLGDLGAYETKTTKAKQNPTSTIGEDNKSAENFSRKRQIYSDKSSMLRYRINENTSFSMSQQLLLRDIIFIFQGIDGKYIRYSKSENSYAIDPKIGIPTPVRVLLLKLSHMGYLFRKVNEIINKSIARKDLGIVGQSLCFVFQEQLVDYYRLMAVLEAQVDLGDPTGRTEEVINSSLNRSSNNINESTDNIATNPALTLRRLFVWIQDPYERLKLMHTIAESTQGIRGGALTSAVHTFTRHGDPMVRTFLKKTMQEISAPVLAMIRRWVFEGDLQDPLGEFFIVEHPGVSNADMWRSKYSLNESMIPSFIPLELAQHILQIGMTINFIRSCCGESQYILDATTSANSQGKEFDYGEPDLLSLAIDRASKIANKFVVDLILKKYELWKHLNALKGFLLLGHGDFVASLMDALVPELSKPASRLFRHNLLGLLDGAVRASNAQYDDEETLERLDVKLLPAKAGDDGWAIFSLDYNLDDPLNTILTKNAMSKYLQVFRFLWRIKRVTHSLGTLWKHVTNSRHMLGSLPQLSTWVRSLHLLRNEMHRFMESLQSYLLFEVLETSWEGLRESMNMAVNLDEVIRAHEEYQRRMIKVALLGPELKGLRKGLHDVMNIVMEFCSEHERILTAALEIIHRRNMHEQHVKARLDDGEWGIDSNTSSNNNYSINNSNNMSNLNDSLNESTNSLNEAAYKLAYEANEKVKATRMKFTSKFVTFMNLAEKGSRSHGQNLHFLTFRMDFNEFYDEAKREALERRVQSQGGGHRDDNEEDQPAFEERLLRQLGASGAGYISRQNSLDSDLATNDVALSAPPQGKGVF